LSINAVIFDFGGVINNMRWEVARELEDEHGLERNALLESLYRNQDWRDVEEGRGDIVEWAVKAHKQLEKDAGKKLPPLHQQWRDSWHPIKENIDIIKGLKPKYKVSILSNADLNLEERIKEGMDIHHLFDDIISSAVVGVAKPKHEIYELAAKRLELPAEECVFIDDAEHNVIAAREVGMRAIHFRVHQGDVLADQLAELGVRPA
jgi:putative hydrolase of the HAD superfamily